MLRIAKSRSLSAAKSIGKYGVGLIDDHQRFLASCEELGFGNWIKVEPFRFVGDSHAGPPKFSIFQLEQKSSVADIKVDNLLVLVALSDDFSYEVDSFVHLHTDFSLDAHLSFFVRAPTIQFAVVHQGNRVRLTTLDLLDLQFLLFPEVLEVFVQGGHFIILVVSVTKGSVLAVAPVVHLVLFVEDNAEISSSSDSLDVMSLQGFDFCGLGYDLWDIFSVASWADRVDKKLHEKADILSSIAKGIDFSFVAEDDGVSFSGDCVFDLDIVLLKIVDDPGRFDVFRISMAELSISAASEGVKIAALLD